MAPQNSQFGLSPGSLVYIGPEVERHTVLKIVEYNDQFHREHTPEVEECHVKGRDEVVTWLDVDGIHEPEIIEQIGKIHEIDSLVLEDIMNTRQKAKIEHFDDYVFIVIKMLHFKGRQQVTLDAEHVSFVLQKGALISFQEKRTGDIFDPVMNRIKASVGKTRKNGADYLLFALMDLVIDHYLVLLEKISEQLDDLEEQILKNTRHDPINELYALKRELTLMRKYVWPIREVLNSILRGDSDLIQPATLPYFRDVHDHVLQAIDSIDAQRELLTALIDIHYSTLSNRMNSVMKTLTIYTALFMPLTLIVGIYGMNFDNMPELRHPEGYFYTLGAMVLVAAGLLFYFRRRGWL
ncbi:MAG: magnesium/cobalt transporter CorA [Spirosomaceae bacterium]|nr:magnesium/cobalt transporter CorA [Spirosomataceae bacterium]